MGQNGFEASAALGNVAFDAADQADVGVGIHKDLNIHQITERLVLKDQNALDDDHALWNDGDGFFRAVVDGIVIDRAFDGTAGLELLEVLDHKIGLERIRMVIVELAALFKGQIVVGTVVVVVAQNGDLVPEALGEIFHQGGLSAAAAACNAND